MLIDLAEWVVDVLDELGYLGVLLLIAAENLFPPMPSEIILPLTGVLIGQDRMWFPWALLASTGGSLVGALTLYGIGALFDPERIRGWIGRAPLLDVDDADRGRAWFDRHGRPAVLFGRLVPVVRSVISLPAGVERMPLLPFVAFTVAGSAVWNAVLIGSGWVLGEHWEVVRDWLERYQLIVIGVAVLAVVAFVARRLWRAHAHR